MCIKVLSYCSLKDALAGRFCNLLTSHLDELQEVIFSSSLSPQDTASDEAALEDFLFDFGPGSTAIQDSAMKLLKLIHRPFSGLENITVQSTLSNPAETTMGTHLEWEWELKSDVRLNNMPGSNQSGQSNILPDDVMGDVLPQPENAAWHIWTPIVES
ncbi:hypothetical protein HBH43_028380 [Parastagonospora nodorum]|nr:hypothetical protein HBH43_028380 [Parastagonospora nodorum]